MSDLSASEHDFVERSIRLHTGNDFSIVTTRRISGGGIHRALCVESASERVFVKIGAAQCGDMFEAEADGLRALAATNTFVIPNILACQVEAELACLCLDYLALSPLSDRTVAWVAGEQLAALHTHSANTYGWHRNNFLGLTPQNNSPHDNWARFMVDTRIGPMLERITPEAEKELRQSGAKLLERIPALLLDYQPTPTLLHGDLWHGNIGVLPDGQIAIFDPAVSHGDTEFDLAMASLFGGFPDSFFAAYRRNHPPRNGHQTREMLYRLYHVLNHVVLFGNAYRREAQRLIHKLLACSAT